MPGRISLSFSFELDQLVGRARAIAVLLRLLDEGVAEMSRQPAGAAFGSGHFRGSSRARMRGILPLCRIYRPGRRGDPHHRAAAAARLHARGAAPGRAASASASAEAELLDLTLFKRSYDARKKNSGILFICIVDVTVRDEAAVLKRLAQRPPDRRRARIRPITRWRRRPAQLKERPLVVGFGPCGLFAALLLAQMGFKPIVLERGRDVRRRTKDTWALWRQNTLTPESNVQFGEGGAGLFSDGKLYSQIKDPKFYGRKVMHEFVRAGAPEEILYVSKPHIGTFRLTGVVASDARGDHRAGRRSALREQGHRPAHRERPGAKAWCSPAARPCTAVTWCWRWATARATPSACWSSARVFLEAKPFAIGFRIEHPQSLIDRARLGRFAGHPRAGRRRLQAGASRAATAARCTASACARAARWSRRLPSRSAWSPMA